jgi:hypothetical protein
LWMGFATHACHFPSAYLIKLWLISISATAAIKHTKTAPSSIASNITTHIPYASFKALKIMRADRPA